MQNIGGSILVHFFRPITKGYDKDHHQSLPHKKDEI